MADTNGMRSMKSTSIGDMVTTGIRLVLAGAGGNPAPADLMNDADNIKLREWRHTDIPSIVRYANNRKIWLNLRDRFPHPYLESDAIAWITACLTPRGAETQFAIDQGGQAIGGIGFELLTDVHRMTAEIGYWVGEPFWGAGIATAAVRLATDYGFATLGLERIQAMVFEWNAPSARVLEKSGYVLEGRLRRSILKDGRLADSLLYARVRS
jgi:ribosomal-protein-alanine N-acetyltransferase